MTDDILKLDKARRNLLLLTSILLFLTMTNSDISTLEISKFQFSLKNTHEYFNTYNEIVFYLLTYFFVRFVSISVECKDYLTYADTTMFINNKEIRLISKRHLFPKVYSKEEEAYFEIGMKYGKYIRIFVAILEEIFLNKNFVIFIFPIIYFLSTVVYFGLNNESNILIIILEIFIFFGTFYLFFSLVIFTFLYEKIKKETKSLAYSKILKEKYKKAKESRSSKINKNY